MGEKLGKVQALVVEFSADCAAIRAKSGEGGYSEAVDSWGKGCFCFLYSLTGNANVFVTNDKILLLLKNVEHLPIISPRNFWEMLAAR